MSNRFVIADLHFGHKGMIQFVRADGTPCRPEWGRADPERLMSDEEAAERVAAMDEAMVERWNSVVRPGDKVEVLGDVVINRRALPILGRLNGKKRLRMGNHDIFIKHHSADYQPYFDEISAYKVMPDDGVIMSHIPVHPCQLERRWIGNIHGHMHDKRVMKAGTVITGYADDFSVGRVETIDERYLCVSVEQINYTPLEYGEALKRLPRR